MLHCLIRFFTSQSTFFFSHVKTGLELLNSSWIEPLPNQKIKCLTPGHKAVPSVMPKPLHLESRTPPLYVESRTLPLGHRAHRDTLFIFRYLPCLGYVPSACRGARWRMGIWTLKHSEHYISGGARNSMPHLDSHSAKASKPCYRMTQSLVTDW